MKRTDTHRPSVIDPSEYEWVAFELIPIGKYSGDIMNDCAILKDSREQIRIHMERTGGTYSDHVHGGNCMVCGSVNAVYTVLFYHAKTNTYVRMGQDCAEKYKMPISGDFNKFCQGMKDVLNFRAGKKNAKAFLENCGLGAAWELYSNPPEDGQYEENTVIDIVRNLVKYGNLSDKQKNFISSLLNKIQNRAKIEADRRAQYDAAKEIDIPIGDRVSITGKVIARKLVDGYYGTQFKMLVQHTDGWKIWGTIPAAIEDLVKIGSQVKFKATITKSKDDPKFGFFSRPSCAEVIE